MGERKVLNKYYPWDFDPAAIPRGKRPRDAQYVVRLMAPFNMRCATCATRTAGRSNWRAGRSRS